jgi:cysteine desulfurase
MGAACELARVDLAAEAGRCRTMRDLWEKELVRDGAVSINGERDGRLPNTSNLCFEGVDGEALMMALDREGIAVSSGSACLSGAGKPSEVLLAMGLSPERARSSLRFSFGRLNRPEEIPAAAAAVRRIVQRLTEIESECGDKKP